MADENKSNNEQSLSPLEKRRRRNRQYYEKNKDNLKIKKESYQLKMEVPKEDAHRLLNIKAKIEIAKERLGEKKTNIDLMEALLDSWLDASDTSTLRQFESITTHLLNLVNNPSSSRESTPTSLPQLSSGQKFQLHSACKENDEIYLVCGAALQRLLQYFVNSGNVCHCGEKFDPSSIEFARVTPNNHCVKVAVRCDRRHVTEWFSSSVMSSPTAGKYYINIK